VAGSVSDNSLFVLTNSTVMHCSRYWLLTLTNRYGEDKDLTEDYAKDIWEFGY
jgi:hypothetical protein